MDFDFSDKPMVERAMFLARDHHNGSRRKYTGEPYFEHPVRVVKTILKLVSSASQDMLAAAFLHDCMEDDDRYGRKMTRETIAAACGDRTARYVTALTCPANGGNRASRKGRYNNQLFSAPLEVKMIKCADIADNLVDIANLDPKFAEQYLNEKEDQLRVLRVPGNVIWDAARNVLSAERNTLAFNIMDDALKQQAEAVKAAHDHAKRESYFEQLVLEEADRLGQSFAMF